MGRTRLSEAHMNRSLQLHLALLAPVTLLLGLLIEYWGWRIVEGMLGEPSFPGFFTLETGGSMVRNALGALVVGVLLFLPTLLVRQVRTSWRRALPWALWAGVVLFYGYMAVLIRMGLRAVGDA